MDVRPDGVRDVALGTVDAAQTTRRASGLPRQCWPTSRTSVGWTVSGSPQPCRRFWRPRPHRAYSPPSMLPEYIKRSEESRVYFDAVEHIEEETKSRHQDIPRPHWPQAVRRRRKRPARNRLRGGRQFNPAILRRDIQNQFTIEVLKRVGIRPQGTYVSGCRIVSEAWVCKWTPSSAPGKGAS